MSDAPEIVMRSIAIGAGATLVMDAWAILLKRPFGVSSLDYRLVGRWIGHFPQGRFAHENITSAAPIRGEAAMGWAAHYATGIAYAGVLIAAFGLDWARTPTLGPALLVGMAAIVAPFFLMQPCFGMGIAASKTPKPNLARAKSLTTHLVFSVGLFVAAWLASDAILGF